MDHKYRHKAALIAAILFLQGACFMPSLVSAAGSVDTSQEEAAVRKAERELLVAQNNLIEAQRALIAKQQLALQQATGKTYPEISSLPSNYSSAAASSDGNKIRPYATAPVIRPVELPIETESVPESLKPTILPGKQAVQNEAATSPVVKMPKTVNMADIQQMIAENHGVLAREEKDIYTTEAAIPFTFTGFSRRESVDAVLDALQAVNGRATFFVTEGEMRKNEAAVRDVLRDGQELALCIYPKPTESVADVCADIIRGKELLKTKYGVDTQLVKQFSGVVRKETQEAVAATGNRLIGTRINAVQSRHKDYPSAEKILPEIFGANTLSATRGGIINIRMDWYTKPDLAAELFLYIKRKKIDNIAYNAFGDVSGVNPANDSAYALRSVGDILADTAHLWTYPVPKDRYLPQLQRHPLIAPNISHEALVDVLAKRYIGEHTVKEDRTVGFEAKDFEKLDLTGNVKTDEPVIFLTFDDWGYDNSINKLLYVLRKHNVPATFFVLTHNMPDNPNLLRAIAMEGHDIGSHTNLHKPMSTENEHKKQVPTESYEEYYTDVKTSYERLESVLGDLKWQDGSPVLTKMMRPPTLAISDMGTRVILENGFEYIVNGHTSTEDYAAPDLETEIKRIRDGLYYRGKVRKGAIFVMHMTATAKYTATALDIILTENEKKADGDPTKFRVGQLSQYLNGGYSQAKTEKQLRHERRKIKWWS
ncbi:polysaccharide deacetylase family protein [Megasphaera elsdenii]|uniref:Polysaccharide deacetylase family protein n=1 Tax=Megasphaera elsdenii TaxID=907 RepID=A0A848EUX9_MEGEL|nr:polysaccharide deacetylase family protein [Megasphaera elsdenii]NMK39270.1 polysaccharide deacetylase family protein [Megasphaera elsdenii]